MKGCYTCKREYFDFNHYLNKSYILNKPAATLLISLIHLHSVASRRNTIYKLTLKDNDTYEVFWTSAKRKLTKPQIKEYHERKECNQMESNSENSSSIADENENYESESNQ